MRQILAIACLLALAGLADAQVLPRNRAGNCAGVAAGCAGARAAGCTGARAAGCTGVTAVAVLAVPKPVVLAVPKPVAQPLPPQAPPCQELSAAVLVMNAAPAGGHKQRKEDRKERRADRRGGRGCS